MKRRRGANWIGPETWGSRFQARRDLLRISQKTIAEITGLTQQSVSRFENDDVHPRAETLERYARSVGSTVEDLFPQELRPQGRSRAAKKAQAQKTAARKRTRHTETP